jgi:hypothetical protein
VDEKNDKGKGGEQDEDTKKKEKQREQRGGVRERRAICRCETIVYTRYEGRGGTTARSREACMQRKILTAKDGMNDGAMLATTLNTCLPVGATHHLPDQLGGRVRHG